MRLRGQATSPGFVPWWETRERVWVSEAKRGKMLELGVTAEHAGVLGGEWPSPLKFCQRGAEGQSHDLQGQSMLGLFSAFVVLIVRLLKDNRESGQERGRKETVYMQRYSADSRRNFKGNVQTLCFLN